MDYLLKSSAIIALFYICYRLFLNKETFFQSNRWYLIIGLVFATFLPSLVIPIYIEYTPTAISTPIAFTNTIATSASNTVEPFNWTLALFWAYGLGICFFSAKLLIELASLHHLIKKNPKKKLGRYSLIEVFEQMAPFSFFKWIVYNPQQFQKQELHHIINHEKVHAKEHHTIDVLLAQICCVMFWFNPLVWLYKKELQQNLEFIADQKAQHISDCEKSYQRLLLKASLPTHQLAVTNKFYNSLIKKRIVMLHKSKSNKLNAWKYALILPLLGIFLMSFNTKEIYVEKAIKTASEKEFIVNANSSDTDLKIIETYFKDKNVKLKFSDIKRDSEKNIENISINTKFTSDTRFKKRMTVGKYDKPTIASFTLQYNPNTKDIAFNVLGEKSHGSTLSEDKVTFSEKVTIGKNQTPINGASIKKQVATDNALGDNPLYIIKGKSYKQSELPLNTITTTGSITHLNKTEGFKKYGNAGKDGVLIFNGQTTMNIHSTNRMELIITKDFTDADFNKIKDQLKKEGVTIKFKGIKRNASGEITAIKIDMKSDQSSANYNISNDDPISPIKISVDDNGKNISIGNASTASGLTFVSTDGNTHKIHTTKSNKNVYLINKDDDDDIQINIDQNTDTNHGKAYAYTVKSYGGAHKIKSSNKVIELKSHDDDDDDDVIILNGKRLNKKITELKSDDNDDVQIIESDTLYLKRNDHAAIQWHDTNDGDENVFYFKDDDNKTPHIFISDDDASLFIIDGKETTKDNFKKLDFNSIEKMEVLKGGKAIEKYGKKAKEGVILITTKKK